MPDFTGPVFDVKADLGVSLGKSPLSLSRCLSLALGVHGVHGEGDGAGAGSHL